MFWMLFQVLSVKNVLETYLNISFSNHQTYLEIDKKWMS